LSGKSLPRQSEKEIPLHLPNKGTYVSIVLKYGALFLILSIWEISGRLNLVDQSFLPSLSASVSAIIEMWQKIHLFMHIMVSLSRVTAGLIFGAAIGVSAGYILARHFPGTQKILEPLLRVFALINPYCLFPLFVVFFGAGETAKICVLAWVTLWPVFFSTISGVRAVDPILIKTARSMNCHSWPIFFKIVLPSAGPFIFSGLRLGVEMSFFVLIAAEMTGATAGLGWIVHNAGAMYQVPRIYGAGICIVILGVFINRYILSLQNGLFFWKESNHAIFGKSQAEKERRISPLKAGIMIAAFALTIAVGLWQIAKAEALLNDPTAIPEYRIYSQ
jgi:NitT/TauT family transport system permease protein